MNIRQKVFILLAILTAVFYFTSFNLSRSIAPGWHVSLSDNLEFSPLVCIVLFIAITIIYGYINSTIVAAWYFWLHVVLSVAPMLYDVFVLGTSSFINNIRFPNSMINEYRRIQVLNILFILNQVTFFLYLMLRQYQEKRKLRTA